MELIHFAIVLEIDNIDFVTFFYKHFLNFKFILSKTSGK